MINDIATIVLAAGKGTRMKSDLPKVLHPIANEPMIAHILRACVDVPNHNKIVVIADDMDCVTEVVAPARTVVQKAQNGTADAVKSAREALSDFTGHVLVLLGDGPLITPETINALYHAGKETGLAVLGFEAADPTGYGRLILNDAGYVTKIVEQKDCTSEEVVVDLCNSGAFCIDSKRLFGWLDKIDNQNAQGEYYMTDIVAVAAADGVMCACVVAYEEEVMGVNSRAQLAQAEYLMQSRLRARAMDNGVTMIDPETVYLSADTQISHDVVIEPNVYFGRGVCVESGTIIHAFSHIEGAAIGANVSVGPYARIRPKSVIEDHVTVGNFIEVNRSTMKKGSKSKHMSYLGDAVIGEKTNIGAGTVVANYDGFNKQDTVIGQGVFVGSNTTIIAPCHVDNGAIIAAGSTVAENVVADSIYIARSAGQTLVDKANTYRKNKSKG